MSGRLPPTQSVLPGTIVRAEQEGTVEMPAPPVSLGQVDALERMAGSERTTAIGATRPVGEVAPRLELNALLPALGYGSSAGLAELLHELEEKPNGRLAAVLAMPAPAAGKTPLGAHSLAPTEPGRFLAGRPGQNTLDRHARLIALICRTTARFSTSDGVVDLGRLERALAGEGGRLLTLLGQLPDRPVPRRYNDELLGAVLDNLGQLMPRAQALNLADRLVRNDRLIPRRVETLDFAMQAVPNGALAGKGLVAVQHLLPTTVAVFEACLAKGMRAEDIHVRGTGYFAGRLVSAYCRLKGMDVEGEQLSESQSQRTAAFHAREIVDFVGHVAKRKEQPPNGWVVLDDGGLLHATLGGRLAELVGFNEMARAQVEALGQRLPEVFPPKRIHGVEQTTRGLTELNKHPPAYPVVKVADAPGKACEADLVGWSLAVALRDLLHQEAGGDQVKKVVVVSAGQVGLRAAAHLETLGYQTVLVDTDPAKVAAAQAAGFAATNDLAAAHADAQAILACTGKRSVEPDSLEGFTGFLASGSSQVVDFDPAAMATRFGFRVRPLNNGRPINFQPDGYAFLDGQAIGLTRALLFLAVCQDSSGAGLHALAGSPQDQVIRFWREHGGEQINERGDWGPDLPPPDALDPAGGADYDWQTFLTNCHRPMSAPVHSNLTGTFFTAADGAVRYIPKAGGVSVVTPLTEVPHVTTGSSGQETSLYLGGAPGAQWLRLGRERESKIELGPAQALGEVLGWCDGRDAAGTGLVCRRNDRLLIFAPEKLETPLEVAMPCRGDVAVAWASELDPVVVLQKKPARAFVMPAPGVDPTIAWNDYALPPEFAEVTGVQRVLYSRQMLILGKDAAGQVLVTALDPTGGTQVMRLPPGARFRGVHIEGFDNYDHKAAVVVDYVAPGGEDEIDRYAEVVLRLPEYARE